jgi:hypothetical protein
MRKKGVNKMPKKSFLILAAVVLCAQGTYLGASELSFQGTAPLTDKSTLGFGVFFGPGLSGAMDTNNTSLEFFYRSSIVDALDWGLSLSPMSSSGFPGTPDLLFDSKTRLFKGAGFFPSLIIGVNLVRFAAIDPSNLQLSPTFLDQGRLGLSWEYTTVKTDSEGRPSGEIKRNNIYLGVGIVPGGSSLGSSYYLGFKFSSLNLMVIYDGQLSSAGVSYSF